MKKATFALTSFAALTLTGVALAQDPAGGAPAPTQQAPAPMPPQPQPQPQPSPDVATPPPPIAAPPIPSLITPQEGSAPSDLPAGVTALTAADATPPAPTPPRETITVRQSYRPNRPLLYTGSSMLISSYVATAGFTMVRDVRDASRNQPTLIPVAGPWMHLANSNEGMLDRVLLAGSGIAQGAGLVIAVLSLIVPEHVPVATIQARGVEVVVTASSSGPGSAGIGALGRF